MAFESRVRGKGGNGLVLALDAADLIRALNKLDRKTGAKLARKTLRAAGRPILNDARRRVPVLSGKLRDSLKIRTSVRKTGNALGRVQATAPHAHLVELGTKPHWQKRKKGGPFRRRRLHPGADPKPYLRPAYDANRADAVAKARDVLRAGILQATRGGG